MFLHCINMPKKLFHSEKLAIMYSAYSCTHTTVVVSEMMIVSPGQLNSSWIHHRIVHFIFDVIMKFYKVMDHIFQSSFCCSSQVLPQRINLPFLIVVGVLYLPEPHPCQHLSSHRNHKLPYGSLSLSRGGKSIFSILLLPHTPRPLILTDASLA